MTSRTQRSSSSRVHEQLFSARSVNDPVNASFFNDGGNQQYPNIPQNASRNQLPSARAAPQSQQNEPTSSARIYQEHGIAGGEESDPLQLEHMLGFAGDFRKTVQCLPNDDQIFVKSLGSLVALENINDPHAQRFCRGHDMPVCSLTISASGRFIASGQVGTSNYKGNAAPVILWRSDTGQRLGVLRGLSDRANILEFSPDEKFLCGCGEDCLIYIWDTSTGECVFAQKQPTPITVFKWADHNKVNHNVAYDMIIGIASTLHQAFFTYDSMRMQWSLRMKAFTTPPMGGLVRNFYCIDISRDRNFIYVGTSSGEIMVYRRDTAVFRSCIPVCSNGVQDLLVLQDDTIVCGGGDGNIVKLIGSDMQWQKNGEVKLDSTIRSLSLSANHQELIVSCSSGAIYRALVSTLSHGVISVSTNSAITSIAFPTANMPYPPTTSTIMYFATGTESGEIRVWDLTDYACLSALKVPKAGSVLCLVMVDTGHILSGWKDGSIRCSDANGHQLWYLPTAHRDGTTTVAVHVDGPLQYFVTGGGDGAIRVWKYSNRELITQYTEHRKGVIRVLVDNQSPNIVHSVGGDGSILSYDLKAGRRITCHIVNTGMMMNMTQKKEREYELITCDSVGRLLLWDIDVRDPVIAVQDPSKMAIRMTQISPSGRYLAFAGDDQIVKILEMSSFQIISLGQSHSAPIYSLHWTPDEKQIITGGADCCLSIWNFYLGGVK